MMRPTAPLLLLSLALGAAAFQPPLASSVAGTPRRSSSALGLVGANHDNADALSSPAASRRAFVASSLALAGASLLPSASLAADAKLEPYEDADFGFRFQVPSSWEKTEQKLSGRRKAVFFIDPTAKDEAGNIETLGFVAYTPLRDDFTSLASFGSVDEVAQTTILPKGELMEGKDASGSKMLSATSKNNAYYFDYVATPVVPNEGSGALTKTLKPQHFRTIFTLLPLKGAAGLTLVTVTLQTTEERYGDVKGAFDGVIDSYGKI